MAHSINGFVARRDALTTAARGLPNAQVCPLHLGYGFLPLTLDVSSLDDPTSEYVYLDRLTAPIATWAVEQSRQFPLAYIQTDYFGGTGSQCAAVWSDGALRFGPVETVDRYQAMTPLLDGAINRAVRLLGVDRGQVRDEFDALGLGLHRNNEGWMEAASKSAE